MIRSFTQYRGAGPSITRPELNSSSPLFQLYAFWCNTAGSEGSRYFWQGKKFHTWSLFLKTVQVTYSSHLNWNGRTEEEASWNNTRSSHAQIGFQGMANFLTRLGDLVVDLALILKLSAQCLDFTIQKVLEEPHSLLGFWPYRLSVRIRFSLVSGSHQGCTCPRSMGQLPGQNGNFPLSF